MTTNQMSAVLGEVAADQGGPGTRGPGPSTPQQAAGRAGPAATTSLRPGGATPAGGARPRLLDAFCCAGGAGMGYHLAGFDVVGVDINPQPRYPFEFVQGDAIEYIRDHGHEYDAIHASPPCQSESDLRHRWPDNDYPDLLTPTLGLLADVSIPWVVENVASTKKLPGSLILCGTEFELKARCRDGQVRWLKRHRRFGSNVFMLGAGGCNCTRRPIGGVYGTGGGGQMNRGYKFFVPEAREAMGIDWMTWPELSQAIPPAYTRFIGEALMASLRAVA